MAASPGGDGPAEYVALGSSFAAGPGLTPRAVGSPRAAGRSAVNYAHLLAAARGLQLVDASYGGAVTADLLGAKGQRPAQLDAVTPSTRLVTMTIGGNDIGYIGGLTMSSLPAFVAALFRVRSTLDGWLDASTLDGRFDALRAALTEIVGRVHERAPDAVVAIVDYLTILPSDPATSTGRVNRAVADWGRTVAAGMSAAFADVAASEGAVFVAAGEASLAHHAWSPQPWTRGAGLSLRGGAPFHPNAEGMRAVAELLDRALP